MADQDGDSHMHSSSSEENDSDAMFPNEQQQTQNLPSSGLYQASELSPPHSQDPPGSDAIGFGNDDAMDLSTGAAQGTSAFADQFAITNLVSNGDAQKNEPGWAWKNKKAREEYSRALEMVIDKNFSLKQYGDPFAEEAPSQPKA